MSKIKFDNEVLIAIDFDGTLTDKEILSDTIIFNNTALDYVRQIQSYDVKTILYTSRKGTALRKAISMLKRENITFDYINKDNGKRNSGRKINADVYIDDRANDGIIDWEKIIDRIILIILNRRKTEIQK